MVQAPTTHADNAAQAPQQKDKSLVVRMAERLGNVDPNKLWGVIKNQCFKVAYGQQPTDEQMLMLCMVTEQYGLNPLTKEIYAFPDKGGIIPVIGVDGWVSILRRQPDYQGCEFSYSDAKVRMPGAEVDCYEWIECTIHLKGKASITVREHLDEVYKSPRKGRGGPWQSHTKRMLRHKALIQAARVAFGFSGVYDPDEADNIRNGNSASGGEVDITPQPMTGGQQTDATPVGELDPSEQQMREQLLVRAAKQRCWRAAIEWVQQHPSLKEGVKQRFVADLAESELQHTPLGDEEVVGDATIQENPQEKAPQENPEVATQSA